MGSRHGVSTSGSADHADVALGGDEHGALAGFDGEAQAAEVDLRQSGRLRGARGAQGLSDASGPRASPTGLPSGSAT